MKNYEISSPEKLDAVLLHQNLEKHRKLWRAAEGRFGWTALIGLLCGGGLLIGSVVFAGGEIDTDELLRLGLGAFLLLQFQIFTAHAKGEALVELLRRLEQRVTRLERKAFADD
jgi:hypothetical protein